MIIYKRASLTIIVIGLVFNGMLIAQESSDEFKEEDLIIFAPVVVTANRIEVPLDRVSSSVVIISSTLIETQQYQNVGDLLRKVTGVNITRSGSNGRLTTLFLRGANSNQTLVLIDGAKVNEPMNGGFDFSNLKTDNIEKIEIVRGSQSTLYGSEAIGGIVNIFTKSGSSKLDLSLNAEAGEFGTFSESGNLSGSLGSYKFSFSLSDLKTDGQFENDDYTNTTLSSRITATFSKDTKLAFTVRKTNAEGGAPNQRLLNFDPNARQKSDINILSLAFNQKISGLWHHKLKLSKSESDINYSNPVNPGDANPFAADFNSSIISSVSKVDWQNDLHVSANNVITTGIEWEEKNGKSASTYDDFENLTNTRSIYLQNHFRLNDKFSMTGGVRTDNHSGFGNSANYRFTSAYIFRNSYGNETKIRGSWGTGFRAPSIFELYSPGFFGSYAGNPNLQPEESISFEFGVDHKLADNKLFISAELFKIEFTNLITITEPGAVNVNKAETKGIELNTDIKISENIDLSGNYTYLETEDLLTGLPLLRRPKHNGGAVLNIRATSELNISAGVSFVGERYDSDFVFDENFQISYGFFPSYKTARLAVSYQLTEQFRLKLRIENLLDEEYSEVAGYPSPGRAVYGGISLKL
ncbi:MAG: TonB-dependent receptor [Candidatus Marinimicrobia bacterium]|nr:TonB-dependent receptor [Candidatus Neomarinimicrobiota bacterium]